MPASTTMTIRLDAATKEKLDRIAASTRRSRSFLAAEAVAAYVEHELPIIEGIEQGIEDMKAGRTVPHEEVVAEARRIIADAKRRQEKKLA